MTKVSYTKEQKDAIEYAEGNLRIIACAGSGKTEVISSKIVKLIKDGAEPKNVVAFTFTNKAAEEMRMRIRSKLDEELSQRADIGEMYIGTIDSYCFQVLQDLEPKFKTYSMLDENQRFSVVYRSNNYYNKIKLKPLEGTGKTGTIKKGTVIERFLKTVDLVRNENINIEQSSMEEFKKCFHSFEKFMEESRLLDFTSVIYELNKLLESNQEIANELAENLKYLVVDEYQDVNNSQERLIENMMAPGKTTLIVVGDDDQNIYNWRGSNVKNILKFDKKYKDVETKFLSTNFRSTKGIIDLAKSLIENNNNRLKKPLGHNSSRAEKYNKGDIVFKNFTNDAEEAEYIVSTIKDIYQRKIITKKGDDSFVGLGDIAILVRKKRDAKIIISKLEAEGIDVVTSIGESVFNSKEVVFVKDILRFIFQLLFGEEEKSLEELKEDYQEIFKKDVYPDADVDRFEKEVIELKNLVEKINEKDKPYIDGGLQSIFHSVLDAIGLSRFELEQESMYYNLAVLSRVIADYEDAYIRVMVKEVKEFFYYYWTYADGHYDTIKNEELEYIRDAVKVLTIHKAKGLEFPVVFLPRFNQPKRNNYPQFMIETTQTLTSPKLFEYKNYKGDDEDDRRTFYVAITRSEKYLYISSSGIVLAAKPTKKPYEPSKFLKEFDKKLIADNPVFKTEKVDEEKDLSDVGILFPTSFSELSSYHKCPYEYKIRRLYGFKAGVPVAFGYGERVHNIINIIYKKFKKTPPTDKQIDTLFDKYFHLRYALKFLEDRLKEKGKGVVKNYVKEYGKEFDLVLETEKNFELVVDNALVNGQIDLIKKMDNEGNIKDIQIIDFKTDNDNSAYKDDKENNLQLRIYAQACLETLGYHPEKASVLNLNTLKTEDVNIKENKLDEAQEEIRTRVKKITKERSFEAKPSTRCDDCDFAKFCSKKHRSKGIKDKITKAIDKFKNGDDLLFNQKK